MPRFQARRFAAAFALSLIVHAAIAAYIREHANTVRRVEPAIAISQLTIERRVPERPRSPVRAARALHRVAIAPAPSRTMPRRIAEAMRAQPQTRARRMSTLRIARVDAAASQIDFQKTIARLRAQSDPVAAAARSTLAPAPQHVTNVASTITTSASSDGYLFVVQSWRDGGYDYYRVRYRVQYSDGTVETGIVPWPIRYPPEGDPFRLGIHRMPLPVPLADFQLPPDTELHPLVAYCWKHRDEYPSCPIARDDSGDH